MAIVQYEIRSGVALVTMNDPDQRNPLSVGMREGLIGVFEQISASADVRSVVLTGAGGAFSSGGDLSAMPPRSEDDATERLARIAVLVRHFRRATVPVVAAIDGVAAGVAMGIAAACDVVVLSDRARLMFPFTRLGLLPDGGALATIAQRVGVAQARRLFLQGDEVSAESALAMGLADEVVSAAELIERSQVIAFDLGHRAAGSVRAIKQFYATVGLGIDDALRVEADIQPERYFSAEFAEGLLAHAERRRPDFIANAD
jgi:enoyl-CoA hydratase/carnithine racemase